jgi:hypothetical protein
LARISPKRGDAPHILIATPEQHPQIANMAHLETLPPEILFNILSYTEPNLNPTLRTYPLNTLAATNKHLNTIVEEYARNLLKRHANIVLPRNTRIYTCRRKWLSEICYFCKKKTQRKACLYKPITCCLACDKREYDKMVRLPPTFLLPFPKSQLPPQL